MLAPLAHVPRAVAGQVAGLAVAVVDGSEVATVVTAGSAELLTATECEAAAALLQAAAALLRSNMKTTGFRSDWGHGRGHGERRGM